jgi:hypothetical protein
MTRRVRIQARQGIGKTASFTDADTGEAITNIIRADVHLDCDQFVTATLEEFVDEVDLLAEVVERQKADARQIADYAVAKLTVSPDDVLIIIPARGVIDNADEARELQDAAAAAFDGMGFVVHCLVIPPGSNIVTLSDIARLSQDNGPEPDTSAIALRDETEQATPDLVIESGHRALRD